MLVHADVAAYLLARRLLTPDSVVDGDVLVRDASRRNQNYQVQCEHGPSYLLKQGIGPDGALTIRHEAGIYEMLWSDTRNHSLRRFLPRYYDYDTESGVLVLELVREAQDFRSYHLRRGRFPVKLARAMGEALGALHDGHSAGRLSSEEQGGTASQLPWILSAVRPGIDLFHNVSGANLQLIGIAQRAAALVEEFDRLCAEWRPTTLIHRDIKWDNWLVTAAPREIHESRVKLVDWEFVGFGDPCWDVGSVFSNYLDLWLSSIPITGGDPPERFLALARYPLERMHPALRAFWQSYVRALDLDPGTADEWLVRAVRFAGARLMQTAFEQMQTSVYLTGNVVCILQLTANILKRPYEAAALLLGIPFQGRGTA